MEGSGALGADPQQLLTPQAQQAIAAQFAQFGDQGQALYVSFLNAVKLSLTSGMSRLFYVGLVFAILTFIGTFFLQEIRLKGKEYFENQTETDEKPRLKKRVPAK
jgi:hypothetical protein